MWKTTAILLEKRGDGVGRALADNTSIQVHPRHPCDRAKGDELGLQLGEFATSKTIHLLGEHDDAAAFGRLIGQRRELRGIGKLVLADARRGDELRRLPVA